MPAGMPRPQEHQLAGKAFRPRGYQRWFREAKTKKGYSGVAIYAKREPDEVRTALGWADFDDEGRYIEARFGNLSVVSLYLPSGSSKEERQAFKFQVMDWIEPIFTQLARRGPRVRDLRRLEHRAHADGHQERASPTRRTPASCPRSATG